MNKKILLSVGALASAITPVVAVVSCGSKPAANVTPKETKTETTNTTQTTDTTGTSAIPFTTDQHSIDESPIQQESLSLSPLTLLSNDQNDLEVNLGINAKDDTWQVSSKTQQELSALMSNAAKKTWTLRELGLSLPSNQMIDDATYTLENVSTYRGGILQMILHGKKGHGASATLVNIKPHDWRTMDNPSPLTLVSSNQNDVVNIANSLAANKTWQSSNKTTTDLQWVLRKEIKSNWTLSQIGLTLPIGRERGVQYSLENTSEYTSGNLEMILHVKKGGAEAVSLVTIKPSVKPIPAEKLPKMADLDVFTQSTNFQQLKPTRTGMTTVQLMERLKGPRYGMSYSQLQLSGAQYFNQDHPYSRFIPENLKPFTKISFDYREGHSYTSGPLNLIMVLETSNGLRKEIPVSIPRGVVAPRDISTQLKAIHDHEPFYMGYSATNFKSHLDELLKTQGGFSTGIEMNFREFYNLIGNDDPIDEIDRHLDLSDYTAKFTMAVRPKNYNYESTIEVKVEFFANDGTPLVNNMTTFNIRTSPFDWSSIVRSVDLDDDLRTTSAYHPSQLAIGTKIPLSTLREWNNHALRDYYKMFNNNEFVGMTNIYGQIVARDDEYKTLRIKFHMEAEHEVDANGHRPVYETNISIRFTTQ